MTRSEAEKKILDCLVEIRKVYLEYFPDGDYLSLFVNRNAVSASNSFDYGEKDHDFPVSVRQRWEEAE